MDISSSSFSKQIFRKNSLNFFYICKLLVLFLFGCSNPLDKPAKTQNEISEILSSARSNIKTKNYNRAIRLLEKLSNECFRDPNLDSEVTLMIAQCCYELAKKKQNLIKGISSCDILIQNYPDFSIKNDVYLLKIRLYFNSLDQTGIRSIENIEKVITTINEYSEICQSRKDYAAIFKKHKNELEKIRLKCLELEVRKRLETGKAYMREGQLFPALDSLAEAIQASRESKVGIKLASEAAKLILELDKTIGESSLTKEKSKTSAEGKKFFFNQEEREYWKKLASDLI